MIMGWGGVRDSRVKPYQAETILFHHGRIRPSPPTAALEPGKQSRLRKSAQDDKWSFCLTAGTLCPANQENP